MHLSMLSKHFRPHISACISVSFSDLMKTTAVVESLSTIQPDVLFQKITSLLQDSINRMRNLHQILLQEYGLEMQHLFRDWERLRLRASDYKYHRIFTLRCLHKELIPVSIKLKSTLKTEKARKIIRKSRERFTSGKNKSCQQYPRQCCQTNSRM